MADTEDQTPRLVAMFNDTYCHNRRAGVDSDGAQLAAMRAVVAAVRLTDTELMRQALSAMEYHREQTRPIERTAVAIEALQARLAKHGAVAKAGPAWTEVLYLVNEYAAAVVDAASHEAASRVDLAKSKALKTLGQLRDLLGLVA